MLKSLLRGPSAPARHSAMKSRTGCSQWRALDALMAYSAVDGNLNTSTNGLVSLVLSIKREDINTVTEGQDQRSLRTVDSEAGCKLGRAGSRESCLTIQRGAYNRKDRPYGHIGIDV